MFTSVVLSSMCESERTTLCHVVGLCNTTMSEQPASNMACRYGDDDSWRKEVTTALGIKNRSPVPSVTTVKE